MAMSNEELEAVKTTKKLGFKHVEAFKLMIYQDEKEPSYREQIWNSRDGVTPFTITSKDGKRKLTHHNWRNDVNAPYYTPQIGERVFCDLTLERSKARARRWFESIKHAATMGNTAAQDNLSQLEGEINAIKPDLNSLVPFNPFEIWIEKLAQFREGEPDLIEVDEAFLKALELRRSKPASQPQELQRAAPPSRPIAKASRFGGMTISELVSEAFQNAKEKGFIPLDERGEVSSRYSIPEALTHIHSEVSEAFEVFRNRRGPPLLAMLSRWKDEKGKPQGFGSELADIIIVTAGLAGVLGIDLEAELKEKMSFNASRPINHGREKGTGEE